MLNGEIALSADAANEIPVGCAQSGDEHGDGQPIAGDLESLLRLFDVDQRINFGIEDLLRVELNRRFGRDDGLGFQGIAVHRFSPLLLLTGASLRNSPTGVGDSSRLSLPIFLKWRSSLAP
jgi:hypothetical protein